VRLGATELPGCQLQVSAVGVVSAVGGVLAVGVAMGNRMQLRVPAVGGGSCV
jgi:hypothetical protein